MSTEADIVEPCPFCTGKAVHGYDGPLDGSGVYPIIFCTVCGAKTDKCPTFGVAIVRWNTRAERAVAAQDMRERCAKVAETADRIGSVWLAMCQTMAPSEVMRRVIVHDIRALSDTPEFIATELSPQESGK